MEAERAIYASVNWTISGLDNGLSHDRHQGIIKTNAGILSSGSWWTNSNEIWINAGISSLNKVHLKRSSTKWRPFYLCFNVLRCRKSCFHSNCAMRLHFTVSFCHMYNAILQVLFLVERNINSYLPNRSQIAKFMGSTWGPPGSCRPHMNPMLAKWTLLSCVPALHQVQQQYFRRGVWRLTPSAESSAPQVSQLDDHWVFSHLGRRSDNQA